MPMFGDIRQALRLISRRNAEGEKREFMEHVMEGEWTEVIEKYNKCSEEEERNEETKINYHRIMVKGKGTALHIAVNNENEDIVKQLVEAIVKHEGNEEDENSALRLTNEKDATALHIAAYRGFTNMCKFIIGENGERKHLIEVENKNGETPLYWAVQAGEIEVFVYLRQFCMDNNNIVMDRHDTSILHVAIHREMFGFANIILHCYPTLRDLRNKDGVTPLEVLATKTSAFKSGTNLSWWEHVIYYCMQVKELKVKSYLERIEREVKFDKPQLSKGNGNKEKANEHVSLEVTPNQQSLEDLKKEDVTFLQNIQKLLCSWRCLEQSTRKKGIGLLKRIRKLKQKHIGGSQLLNKFMEEPYKSYMGDDGVDPLRSEFYDYDYDDDDDDDDDDDGSKGKEESSSKDLANVDEKEKTFLAVAKSGIVEIMEELNSKAPPPSSSQDIDKKGLLLVAMKNIEPESSSDNIDKMETAYLVAAKNGVVEIVSQLQSELAIVVHDTNAKKENVLLVAVKNKQPLVVVELAKIPKKRFRSLILGTDHNGNTVLHLAAGGTGTYSKKNWQIAGAAMQMMWDIKWYKYIKDLVPEQFNFRSNNDGKTPGQIFKEEHAELLQKSSDWLKDTAESCSVVAALIAGVSFATSSSVPGGTKDETGKPILEGQPAFDAFAISSLLGLYFSVTALIMFLSILTSRKQIEDFRRNLPLKLLFGLSSLFISIASMLTSFCAGHFFVLTDKYKDILFPLYVATCFPITFYAVVQFPLYLDLVKVIVKKVPPPSVIGVQL